MGVARIQHLHTNLLGLRTQRDEFMSRCRSIRCFGQCSFEAGQSRVRALRILQSLAGRAHHFWQLSAFNRDGIDALGQSVSPNSEFLDLGFCRIGSASILRHCVQANDLVTPGPDPSYDALTLVVGGWPHLRHENLRTARCRVGRHRCGHRFECGSEVQAGSVHIAGDSGHRQCALGGLEFSADHSSLGGARIECCEFSGRTITASDPDLRFAAPPTEPD